MKKSLLYALFYPLVWAGGHVFYRRFTVVGQENMPGDNEPTILISNHQNGMMDPIMLCITNPRQLHFLTRADIFQKKATNFILRSINMLPVYRPHDKRPDAKRRNLETFNTCTERISNGQVVALFPEGNHNNKKTIRMIKPGVAKMSLNVMANLKNPLDLNIVPVGLEYSNYKRFRSDLLVKFGPAFKPAQVVEGNFDQGNAKAVRAIRDMVRKHLTEEVVHIEEQQFYDAFQTSREVAEPVMLESLKLKSGHYEEFQAFKRFVEKADSELKKDENRGQEFIDLTAEYEKLKNEHLLFEDEIRAYENKSYNKAWRTLALGLLWPIYALGFALNVLPMRITESFVSKNIKDPHFVSSIRVAVGAFAYLFYFIILGTTLALVFNFWLALLIVSTTIMLGLFSLRYFEWMRSFGNYRRIEKLDTKIKDAFFNKRGKLLSLIKELTQTV